jgi:hypothetical protein
MIYSEVLKMDSKQFVIKSNKTHIILNAKIVKIIKYKIYYNRVLVFYKLNNKIYQRFITMDYFNNKCGTPRFLCTFILHYKPILAYRELRKLSYRYLRIHFPVDLKETLIHNITKELFRKQLDIVQINVEEFNDFDKSFQIISVETDSELESAELLQIEKHISDKLKLYSKNIILQIY